MFGRYQSTKRGQSPEVALVAILVAVGGVPAVRRFFDSDYW